MGLLGRTCALAAVIAATLATAGGASARTPLPQVTGPLPVSADVVSVRRRGPPARAAEPRASAATSRRSTWSAARPTSTSGRRPARRRAHAGRALHHPPARPAAGEVHAHFSGNVIVEPLNPSNLFDLNIGWALSHKQFMRNGDVWVGITAKPITVLSLKTFDPAAVRARSRSPTRSRSATRATARRSDVVDPPDSARA